MDCECAALHRCGDILLLMTATWCHVAVIAAATIAADALSYQLLLVLIKGEGSMDVEALEEFIASNTVMYILYL